MPRNYRRTFSPPLEITDLQRKAWRWQWLTLIVSLPLLVPLSMSLEKWLPLLLPRGAAMPIPPRQVSQISVLIPIGMMFIVLGWLSIYFRVTILARRLDFWRPTVGFPATLYGWIVLLVGFAIILVAAVTAWPILRISPLALPLVGGVIFTAAAFWLILRGLKRALDEKPQWN